MRERADILYRPFEPGDFEAVAELMRAQWSCDLEGAAGEYSASIDLCGYLADADWGLVAEGRGQVLGAVPVSYTHLDVYKRQPQRPPGGRPSR